MSDPAGPLSLNLLQTLRSPSSGGSRAWQSLAHPDLSTPLLATASADKSVNIYSLKDYSLVSTISGGHKRSVRTVAWKDFGHSKRGGTAKPKKKNPVVLGTGSFDANVGIWVWNDQQQRGNGAQEDDESEEQSEIDINSQEEDNEEWHFSTLLTGPDSEIKSIEFSPSHYPANLLATSSRDKSVWIWEEVEPEEWETIAVLSEHTGDVKCVGWCTGAERRRKRRKIERREDSDIHMTESVNDGPVTTQQQDEEDGEQVIIGARPLLASGSYDDTIRLWRDVEEEGDWICVAVIATHTGTVWDVKWEGHINYDVLDLSSPQSGTEQEAIEEFEADWQPRILSCSDDLSVRVWKRELNAAEKEKRRQSRHNASQSGTGAPMGFASSRIPSVIRPMSAMENWIEDAALPQVHVRSVYAVDWSRRTGLVVSCGGDGTIAIYKELPVPSTSATQPEKDSADAPMNGTTPASTEQNGIETEADAVDPYKLHPMQWQVIAQIDAAHDEYEINHVCWAERRDSEKRFDGEEMIVSTGDEGDVRLWILPEEMIKGLAES